MFDIVALGESLIDFTPAGKNELGMQLYCQNPGGAPANVLAMAAKLGANTAFIGKVGDDNFGQFLTQTMARAGIDVKAVRRDRCIPTTLAFVQLDERRDRSFTFYRKPGADVMLHAHEVPQVLLSDCSVFHFGGVSLTDEPCRSAALASAQTAKLAGAVVSYDPNYRPFLWPDEETAVKQLIGPMQLADIVKVSGEELALLTRELQPEAGARVLARKGPSIIIVTLGAEGSYFFTPQGEGRLPAYAVDTVDTTGAGDAFLGSLLYCLHDKSRHELLALPEAEWERIVRFANAAGSLTTAATGAIPAMPDAAAISACIERGATL